MHVALEFDIYGDGELLKSQLSQFHTGQEVEWLTRPNGDKGYLRGIVFKVGTQKVGITVKSRTGEEKRKWAEPRNLRPVKTVE